MSAVKKTAANKAGARPADPAKAAAGKAVAGKAVAGKAAARKTVARKATPEAAPPAATPEAAPPAASPGDANGPARPTGRPSRWAVLTDPSSLVPTYLGVIVIVAGFALMFLAWAQVGGQSDVWRQMPFVMSSALPGLGLVMVGTLVVNLAARRQDGARRAQQMAALAEGLRQLGRSGSSRP